MCVPPRTLRSCEQQLVCGVHAQHRLGVALGDRDALQRRRPASFHAADGIDDAPEDHTRHGSRAGRRRGFSEILWHALNVITARADDKCVFLTAVASIFRRLLT